LAHYHPVHHHFYEAKSHLGKRIFTIVIAGTGFLADSYDLFVINIGEYFLKTSLTVCKSGQPS